MAAARPGGVRRRAPASRTARWIERGARAGAATRWRSGRTWSTTTASRRGYASVKRFVREAARRRAARSAPRDRDARPARRRRSTTATARWCAHPETGKYRRTRLFVLTLGYSRKCRAAARVQLEHADLGRAARAGVSPARRRAARRRARQPEGGRAHARRLRPGAQSALSRRARALRRRRAAVPRAPSRPQGQGRVGRRPRAAHAAARPALREARGRRRRISITGRARWADTRIHGTTKRQVAAMFAEEQPHLLPLPVEPFRYYEYGERTVHLDGCVEVEGAYYQRAAGHGSGSAARCSGTRCASASSIRSTGAAPARARPAAARPAPHARRGSARSARPPTTLAAAGARAARAGRTSARSARRSIAQDGETGVRRILGVLSLVQAARRPPRRGRVRRGARARRPDLPLRAPLPRAPARRCRSRSGRSIR